MTRTLVLAGLALAAIPAAALAERIVDYGIDEATAAKNAAEQGLPLAPLPVRGTTHVALAVAPAVDHEVLRVGIACSAWTVRNPMSTLLRRVFAGWDRDGAPAAAAGPGVDTLVTIDRAATLSRCVASGELTTNCITRVTIDGTVVRGGGAPAPLHIEREETTRGIGACAGLTRGIGLVSRDAAIAAIAAAGGTG